MLFYLTSANSGAMVMSNFSSTIPDPSQDGAKWLRIFWALVTALLTIAMLVAGGVTTMEYATLIFALPVTIIAWLVMVSFTKALRMERTEREGRVLRRQSMAVHGGHVADRTWGQRLARIRSYPSKDEVARFIEVTAQPALAESSRSSPSRAMTQPWTPSRTKTPVSQAMCSWSPSRTTAISTIRSRL